MSNDSFVGEPERTDRADLHAASRYERPRYAPSTTKADWIAYSERLEAAFAEHEALLDIALAAANFRDSFSLPIGESYVAAESLDAAFAQLEKVRRGV